MSTSEDETLIIDNMINMLNFYKSREMLKDIITETKLLHSPVFSKESNNQIYIKPENLQLTGAFKIRGAFNKVSKLSLEERQRGLVTSSAGNHAQGVAYSAQKLGVKATIVMPKTTPLIKVEATRNYGVEVVLFGDCYDEAYSEACRLEKENNYIFIHPFDDLDVIEGQGTISLEILDELNDVDCILVPIGGGGLISGIAIAAKNINPIIKIIGVEPEGAMSMKKSIEEDKIITLDYVSTIADGAAVKRPGDLNYAIIKNYVDEIITVSDYDIKDAFLVLLENHKIIGENAGLLALAGLKKITEKDKKIVCIVSGGNIDVLTISTLINQGLVSRGRICCFTVNLCDKPGEVLKLSEILAKLGANIIQLDHNQFKGNNRFMDIELEVSMETNGHEHVELIVKELEKQGYCIKIEY